MGLYGDSRSGCASLLCPWHRRPLPATATVVGEGKTREGYRLGLAQRQRQGLMLGLDGMGWVLGVDPDHPGGWGPDPPFLYSHGSRFSCQNGLGEGRLLVNVS